MGALTDPADYFYYSNFEFRISNFPP